MIARRMSQVAQDRWGLSAASRMALQHTKGAAAVLFKGGGALSSWDARQQKPAACPHQMLRLYSFTCVRYAATQSDLGCFGCAHNAGTIHSHPPWSAAKRHLCTWLLALLCHHACRVETGRVLLPGLAHPPLVVDGQVVQRQQDGCVLQGRE
jgi:hypothetical protein